VETIKLFLTKFTDETITISGLSLLFITCVLIIYWIYNRKKFHRLTHQIPASVVKNYLDSIIQNSTSLKSSLFRGGGMDLGSGIPSVMPVSTLPTSGSVSAAGGVSSEELNQRLAEIAALQKQMSEKNQLIADLEAQLAASGGGGEDVSKYKEEIIELEEQLAAAQSAGDGGAGELQKELASVTRERDEYKERLMEYEIIEEDLANLKRLQQENEQLKKSLAAAGGAVAAAAVVDTMDDDDEPVAAAQPEEVVEELEDEVEEMEAVAEVEDSMEAAEDTPMPEADGGEQKSAEELLSEFEKMLG